MREVTLENGIKACSLFSLQYVQTAVQNVEKYLKEKGKKFPPCAETLLGTKYRPELDFTPKLQAKDAAYHQSLIGILRWMVELGRVDICCEISMMLSSVQLGIVLPHSGHLEQLYHIFLYLRNHHNTKMVFHPTESTLDEELFEN